MSSVVWLHSYKQNRIHTCEKTLLGVASAGNPVSKVPVDKIPGLEITITVSHLNKMRQWSQIR